MALARFRFPDSSPSYTPEFPQGAALNHEPPALPLSYAGPYARFYGIGPMADESVDANPVDMCDVFTLGEGSRLIAISSNSDDRLRS
jgi:hypothetical protein